MRTDWNSPSVGGASLDRVSCPKRGFAPVFGQPYMRRNVRRYGGAKRERGEREIDRRQAGIKGLKILSRAFTPVSHKLVT